MQGVDFWNHFAVVALVAGKYIISLLKIVLNFVKSTFFPVVNTLSALCNFDVVATLNLCSVFGVLYCNSQLVVGANCFFLFSRMKHGIIFSHTSQSCTFLCKVHFEEHCTFCKIGFVILLEVCT